MCCVQYLFECLMLLTKVLNFFSLCYNWPFVVTIFSMLVEACRNWFSFIFKLYNYMIWYTISVLIQFSHGITFKIVRNERSRKKKPKWMSNNHFFNVNLEFKLFHSFPWISALFSRLKSSDVDNRWTVILIKIIGTKYIILWTLKLQCNSLGILQSKRIMFRP